MSITNAVVLLIISLFIFSYTGWMMVKDRISILEWVGAMALVIVIDAVFYIRWEWG